MVLARAGAVAGVDVRGAAPGTRETDLLEPCNLVEQVHAVMLAGGSAWGLDAAIGAMRWLEEHGIGLDVRRGSRADRAGRRAVRPVVGDARIRPDAAAGYAACAAASQARPPKGNVGAGSGAVVGKMFGMARAMKGGIGTASVTVDGVTVGALMACNAAGRRGGSGHRPPWWRVRARPTALPLLDTRRALAVRRTSHSRCWRAPTPPLV